MSIPKVRLQLADTVMVSALTGTDLLGTERLCQSIFGHMIGYRNSLADYSDSLIMACTCTSN